MEAMAHESRGFTYDLPMNSLGFSMFFFSIATAFPLPMEIDDLPKAMLFCQEDVAPGWAPGTPSSRTLELGSHW